MTQGAWRGVRFSEGAAAAVVMPRARMEVRIWNCILVVWFGGWFGSGLVVDK